MITVAGVADNVVGLVYVSGYTLEERKASASCKADSDSDLAANIVYAPYPIESGEAATDVSANTEAIAELA